MISELPYYYYEIFIEVTYNKIINDWININQICKGFIYETFVRMIIKHAPNAESLIK